MSEFYIYKYVYKNDIIYIGKTNSSLFNRIKEHNKEGRFKQYKNAEIYCFQCKNRIETEIYEKYLINKYKPVLNIADKLPQKLDIFIEEKEWIKYEKYLSKYKKRNTIKKCEINGIRNVYPVFFTKTNDNILVEVPDFNILTEGTDMNNAIDMARDAIELKCVSMEDDKEEIPTPSDYYSLNVNNGIFSNQGETIISLIDIDSKIYREKTSRKMVRKNVSLPNWINKAADRAGVNVSRILQDALMNTLKLENRM